MKNLLVKLGLVTFILGLNISVMATNGQMGTTCGRFDTNKPTDLVLGAESTENIEFPIIFDDSSGK